MPLEIVRNDITKMQVDVIVNAANESLLGGGGVDGAIHKAAGPGLLEECRKLGGCKTGQAKITKGYDLPAKYVIHTVGPIWHGGLKGEKQLLYSCYANSLQLAKKHGAASIAFPLISSGAYGYPKDKALKVAVDAISAFLLENDMTVYIAVFDKSSYSISKKLYSGVKRFIDDNYVDINFDQRLERKRFTGSRLFDTSDRSIPSPPIMNSAPLPSFTVPVESSLMDALDDLDESFSQALMRMIDEKGLKDPECYKKANIDRKLFSKIRSDVHYKPSKRTALSFAIALELDLESTNEFLKKAGYTLSRSSKFDVIVEYFITHGIYDIHTINQALFEFDQMLLGG